MAVVAFPCKYHCDPEQMKRQGFLICIAITVIDDQDNQAISHNSLMGAWLRCGILNKMVLSGRIMRKGA